MKTRNLILAILLVLGIALFAAPLLAADTPATDGGPAFQVLERVEMIVYGQTQGGGLMQRLNNVERDVFGRELPGSLTERQTAMLNFLEKGSESQPSLLFKLAVAEWAVTQDIKPDQGIARRVDLLEGIVEGTVQGGAYAARVERLITRLLPDGVLATRVELPVGTVVKSATTEVLAVGKIKKDDKIVLKLVEEIVINDMLIAPKGSRVFGHIAKVKPPRSFGRPSEIEVGFDAVEVLGPESVPITVGEAAKKALEADSAMIGAAGASMAGAILLGPLGLATGVLIRGSDKQIAEGTLFYVETMNAANVQAYKVPPQINLLITIPEDASQGTGGAADAAASQDAPAGDTQQQSETVFP